MSLVGQMDVIGQNFKNHYPPAVLAGLGADQIRTPVFSTIGQDQATAVYSVSRSLNISDHSKNLLLASNESMFCSNIAVGSDISRTTGWSNHSPLGRF